MREGTVDAFEALLAFSVGSHQQAVGSFSGNLSVSVRQSV